MKRELRVHSVPTKAEQIRIIVEIVAIVAAGIWALYTFVYEQRIKPLAEAPSFSIATVVEQSATTNGVVFLTVRKRLENTGNVGIDIAAEALSVYGEQIAKRRHRESRTENVTRAQVTADVPRRKVALLFSIAKLRNGAVQGNQNIAFYVPPHSSERHRALTTCSLPSSPANTTPTTSIRSGRDSETPKGGYRHSPRCIAAA